MNRKAFLIIAVIVVLGGLVIGFVFKGKFTALINGNSVSVEKEKIYNQKGGEIPQGGGDTF